MSKPAVPRSQTPALPTRRQLDELDALLQRMLELPVSHAAESQSAPLENPESEDSASPEANDWPSAWEESSTKADESESIPAAPIVEPHNAWHSGWSPSPDVDRPIVEAPQVEFPPLPPENQWREAELPAPKSWETAAAPADSPLADASPGEGREPSRSRFGPPTLQVILGCVGLICLLGSLALFAYDWFDWTW
jgi:hypothetical protein